MRHTHSSGKTLLAIAITGVFATQNARALSFQPSDDVTVDWDTTLSYGAAWRMQKADDDLLADINGDDGNRNFKKGSMINNRFSIISEVDTRYKNMGLFLRGSAFYDEAYYGKNDNDSAGTYNGYGQHNRFSGQLKNSNGSKARMLDAFAYGTFDFGERSLSLRVGQQVVSWGTSLFIPGLSTAQSPADASKSTIPGVEVKDIYLPVGQVLAQFDLTNSLTVSAYSQWEWKKTEVNESGSYFSYTDMLDEAGAKILLPEGTDQFVLAGINANLPMDATNSLPDLSLTRGSDIDAKDTGQWGVALEYFAENLGYGTDFGFYYINYHDKAPIVKQTGNLIFDPYAEMPGGNANPLNAVVVPTGLPTSYHLEYAEDIRLTGASFSTVIGNTNVGGELAHRKDAVVYIGEGANQKATRGSTAQVQLSAIHSFGQTSFADEVMFTGEVGYNKVLSVKEGSISDLTDDRSGSGLAGQLTFKYNNVAPATNLEIPISFSKNFNGNSAAGTFTNGQNTDRMSIAAKIFYKDNVEASVAYTAYFGDAKDNKYTDRDFASINLKYSF